MQVKKGVFTTTVSDLNPQSITGVGFQPKGLIIWGTYQTASGFADELLLHIGLCDHNLNQNSSYGMASDNNSPNDCNRSRSGTNIILIQNLTGTNVRVGAITSMDADGFTIDWSTADAVAAIFHYMAFGGDEIDVNCNALSVEDVQYFALDNTDLDFSPTCGIAVWSGANADSCNTPSIGWWAKNEDTGIVTQGSNYFVVEDAQATSDTHRYQRTDSWSSVGSPTTGAVFAEFLMNMMGPTIRINGQSTTSFVHVLMFKGVSAHCVASLQPAAPGTVAVTGLGFSPKGVLVASVGQTAQTTLQTQARESLGGSDGTDEGHSWVGSADAVNPSVSVKRHDETKIVSCGTPNATAGSSTTEAEADLASLDADGFTLDWTTADATLRQVITFAIGNGSGSGGEHSAVF